MLTGQNATFKKWESPRWPLQLVWGLAFISLSGCSGLKSLEEGQKLYTGAELKIEAPEKYGNASKTEEALLSVIVPEPNSTLLGFMRPELWFYHIAGEPKKEKGLKHWIKTKLGRPPVLAQNISPERVTNLMRNRLNNLGYFDHTVSHEWEQKKKTASLLYQIKLTEPYKIKEVNFPADSTPLASDIRESQAFTTLDSGMIYDLDQFKQERARIDSTLKQKGYYYFNADYLLFKVDTTLGNRQMALYLNLKQGYPQQAGQPYKLNTVDVFTDYALDIDYAPSDTTLLNKRRYYAKEDLFKPHILDRYIFLDSGEVYKRLDHNFTLDKLNGLNVFKFVNVRFKEIEQTAILDANIYLVPMRKKTLQVETSATSKSNNFVGTGINATFTNRNFLKGAEHFSLNLKAGFETLVSSQQSGVNSYELGMDVSLDVPRFLIPFADFRLDKKYVPHTQFMLGGEVLKRVRFYRLNSLNFNYGFRWNETSNKSHSLNPIAFKYVQLRDTTAEFSRILQNNRLLARSFEDQFILGSNYTYVYNNDFPKKKKRVYWIGNIDLSGNLMHLLQTLGRREDPTEDNPFQIFGDPYSQYVRASSDLRYYYSLGAHATFAARFFAGAGIPVGNSSALPYIKQFFSGGSNSIRAFPARSVGPGTYAPTDSLANSLFLDQSGDIKLEGNVELRFDLVSYLKGAVFVDAGNTWLVKEDPDRPGAAFNAQNIHRELAIGTGLGLRIDTDFFVLRFDWGLPLRKLVRENNQLRQGDFQWTFDRWQHSSWRSENIVLNIAIGYPF